MPTTLTFRLHHDYSELSRYGITVPLVLTVGGKSVRLLGKVDTGASFCIFQRVYGEQLGLDIPDGGLVTVQTANSEFRAYGHEVTISCFEWQFNSTVYFPADPQIRRNVLGRRGWLEQFRMGLIDYTRILHLSHYNDP